MKLIRLFTTSMMCLVAMTVFAVSAKAKDYNLEEAGITFSIPDDWKCEFSQADCEYKFISPDQEVGILFWTPPAKDFVEAVSKVKEGIDAHLNNVHIKIDGHEEVLNGMKTFVTVGTGDVKDGELKGKHVYWSMALMQGSKLPVISLAYNLPHSLQKDQHAKAVKMFHDSLRQK